jgi:hypothetical protein
VIGAPFLAGLHQQSRLELLAASPRRVVLAAGFDFADDKPKGRRLL